MIDIYIIYLLKLGDFVGGDGSSTVNALPFNFRENPGKHSKYNFRTDTSASVHVPILF